ncbi:hypothetical protein [Rhizobium sp. BK661]|uniref:hypothetical protein n=1 Tax=Rhizobium sp. BK661 TaxID=2586991 RepID=UPI002168559E|nr:hypothetical protein [Rhizobium sp. BK661]MCS3743114.1 hypothetical protein [Rhizobium sp. BK661]
MKDRSFATTLMNIVIQGIFVAFPLSCAAVVVYDLWAHGLQAVTMQFALGIISVILLANALVTGIRGLDFALEETRHLRHDATVKIKLVRQHLAKSITPRPIPGHRVTAATPHVV